MLQGRKSRQHLRGEEERLGDGNLPSEETDGTGGAVGEEDACDVPACGLEGFLGLDRFDAPQGFISRREYKLSRVRQSWGLFN